MLVVVFNDGTTHKIKGCTSYSTPSCGYYGIIEINGTRKGTFYDKTNIAFCYFDEDNEGE